MVKKAILLKENEKLKRCLFIYQNIGIGVNASTLENEMAAKKFLECHPDYNHNEISEVIKINRTTLWHYLYTRVEKPWFIIRNEFLVKEIITIFNESRCIYGADKIVIALRHKGINSDKKTILKIMAENNLKKKVAIKKVT